VRGHHDHLRVGTDLAQPRERREAVEARHLHVEEDEIERLGLEGAQGARPVVHRGDVVAGLLEPFLEHPAEAVFVVGDENARGHASV
jgi:hypothetical protein